MELKDFVGVIYQRRKDGRIEAVRITLPKEWAKALGLLEKQPKRLLARVDLEKRVFCVEFPSEE